MLKLIKNYMLVHNRNFKNFGHKRQPEAGVTVLWHGFLTFTFIGFGLNWERIGSFFLGESTKENKTSPLET